MPNDLVTQADAARRAGVTRQAVANMIARCRIGTYGRDRLVSLSEVLNRPRDPGGRPRKRREG